MSGFVKVGRVFVNLANVRQVEIGLDRETLYVYFAATEQGLPDDAQHGAMLIVRGREARALLYYLDMLAYDVIGGPL